MNKVKVAMYLEAMSLISESKTIDRILRRLRYAQNRDNDIKRLQDYRENRLPKQSRIVHLARAYLSGKAYTQVENTRRLDREEDFYYDVIPSVLDMLHIYHIEGPVPTMYDVIAWVDDLPEQQGEAA